jgi:hypothetical protein
MQFTNIAMGPTRITLIESQEGREHHGVRRIWRAPGNFWLGRERAIGSMLAWVSCMLQK